MQHISTSDHTPVLRRLIAGKFAAVTLFVACCLASGRLEFAFAASFGGVAVVFPEFLQYLAARNLAAKRECSVPLVRGIHMAKLLLTVALAVGFASVLNAAGHGSLGLVAGMVAAFAGHLVLARA